MYSSSKWIIARTNFFILILHKLYSPPKISEVFTLCIFILIKKLNKRIRIEIHQNLITNPLNNNIENQAIGYLDYKQIKRELLAHPHYFYIYFITYLKLVIPFLVHFIVKITGFFKIIKCLVIPQLSIQL